MTNYKKDRYGVIFAVLCIILCVLGLFGGSPNTAYAADTATYSDVMTDLNNATIDGKPFDVADYPYNDNALPQVLTLAECGFSLVADRKCDFVLFVYVYNPGGLFFSENGNKLQLATEYSGVGKPVVWNKFDLEFCSKSYAADNAELFYKFRILDPDNTIYDRVVSIPASRRYDVSGIELFTKNSRTATEYKVSGTYTYTGYALGCDDSAVSTPTIDYTVSDIMKILRLDVRQTHWRSQSSAQGKYHRNQLNSVYFSIPKEFADLGTIRQIHAEWYEYKTNLIFVTSDRATYDDCIKYVGFDVGQTNAATKYGFGIDWYSRGGGASSSLRKYDYAYNSWQSQGGGAHNYITRLDYAFYTDRDITSYVLPRKDLTNWIYNYHKTYPHTGSLDIKDGSVVAKNLFMESVDEGRTRGYNNLIIDDTDTYDLISYSDKHGFWDIADDYGFWNALVGNVPKDDSISGVKPIYAVKESDLSSVNSLYIADEDMSDFKGFYSKASRSDETVYLFRFALSDYYAAPGYAGVGNKDGWGSDQNAYGAFETVFLDFDVIDISFYNDVGKSVVVPIISSPIDIIGSVDPPPENLSFWDKVKLWFEKNWRWVIVGIVCVIVLIILMPFMPTILSLLVSFLQLVIKGIWWLIKHIGLALWWIICLPFRAIAALINHKRGGE